MSYIVQSSFAKTRRPWATSSMKNLGLAEQEAAMRAYDKIHALALEQHGLFTTEQARDVGVRADTLMKMAARGRIARQSYGLYRDNGSPTTRWQPYMAAVLWPRGMTGILSYTTALELMDLSDANPSAIHVTVPKRYRARRRESPSGVILHHADLGDSDIGSVEGLPTTTAVRAVRDCATAKLGPALLRQAIEDGRTRGWLSSSEAAMLISELTEVGQL